GAFAYCEEDDTYAAKNFKDATPDEVKQARLDALMALQEEISAEIQAEKVGRNLRVIVDREEDEFFIGRTEWDSPEVDPEVLITKEKPLIIGNFAEVNITSATAFELMAKAL
ncbi:MAG: TRAM domain-containing protein, partial [Muribaculaceae bacterium]|nr:TRAM domain-containing protein [Muribaculaceae bacterium]